MYDIAGKEIEVGDTVAYTMSGYSELVVGRVLELSTKTLTVQSIRVTHGFDRRKPNQVAVLSKTDRDLDAVQLRQQYTVPHETRMKTVSV